MDPPGERHSCFKELHANAHAPTNLKQFFRTEFDMLQSPNGDFGMDYFQWELLGIPEKAYEGFLLMAIILSHDQYCKKI